MELFIFEKLLLAFFTIYFNKRSNFLMRCSAYVCFSRKNDSFEHFSALY
jgi:hypothetical protein